MNKWKSIEHDGYPEIGKPLWYFFEYTGVSFGSYYGAEDHSFVDNDGSVVGFEIHYFGGKKGFLGDDVTHWQYGNEDDEKPEWPEEFRNNS